MIVRFGNYELDADRYELRLGGQHVPIERRVFDLVHYLAINALRVVPKEELLTKVWRDRHVADGSISVAISAARRALGDDAARQAVIRTCHGRGYQFVLPCNGGINAPIYPSDAWNSARQTQSDLVGRTHEMNEIAEATTRLLHGSSTLLLVSGEPGIGKTRLLDEAISVAKGLDIPSFLGLCAESGDAPAMWPWSQVFRAMIKVTNSDWTTRILPQHIESLSMIVPEVLAGQTGDLPDYDSADAARFRLFEGLLESLLQLLGDQRILIAFDDLHRADHSSIGFFRFAARELRRSPVLLLGTHRIGELRNSSYHSSVLAELVREPNAASLHLEKLSPDETTQLFQKLCSTQPFPHNEDLVYRQTGGNPFFIRQLASLSRTGVERSNSQFQVSLPTTLRLSILEQIEGLSQSSRQVLNSAAALGREFSLRILADLSPLDRAEFDAAVDELIESQILRRRSEDADILSFVHILVRDALYEHLGLAERRTLHELIGSALAAKHGSSSPEHAGELAYHLFEAQTPESLALARRISETAARAAGLRSAHDDAERHYLRALEALRLTEPSNEEEHCRLLLALGTEQCHSGSRGAAKQTFSKAASIARSLGSTETLARAALGVAPGFLAAEAGGSDAFLEDLLEEALASIDPAFPSLKARIGARLAMAIHWSNARSRMREAIAIARDTADRIDEPQTKLHVLVARWFCEWNHERFDERSDLADRILSSAEAIRDREMILMGMMLRQVSMLERGEISAFDASFGSFASLASELRQPQSLWYTPLYRSMRALLDGRMSRALDLQSEFASVAARVEDANAFHSLVAQSCILASEMGTLATGITSLVEGAARFPGIPAFRAAVAWAYVKTGSQAEARREFAPIAHAGFSDLPERFDWPTAVALCAEVACDLGDTQRAATLFRLLEPLGNRFLFVGLGVASFGSAARLLGRLSETMGRAEQAEAYFRVAVERNAAAGAHAWTAHTKLDYALLLARTGGEVRRDYRVQLASDVLETATDLGLVTLRRRAESFLETGRDGGVEPALS